VTEQQLARMAKRRLAILRHAEEITGNVALTCRSDGISRQCFSTWKRRDRGRPAVWRRPGAYAEALQRSARPDAAKMSLATELSLIWASSSSFSTRCSSRVRSWMRARR
jgi:hypothetical protein